MPRFVLPCLWETGRRARKSKASWSRCPTEMPLQVSCGDNRGTCRRWSPLEVSGRIIKISFKSITCGIWLIKLVSALAKCSLRGGRARAASALVAAGRHPRSVHVHPLAPTPLKPLEAMPHLLKVFVCLFAFFFLCGLFFPLFVCFFPVLTDVLVHGETRPLV